MTEKQKGACLALLMIFMIISIIGTSIYYIGYFYNNVPETLTPVPPTTSITTTTTTTNNVQVATYNSLRYQLTNTCNKVFEIVFEDYKNNYKDPYDSAVCVQELNDLYTIFIRKFNNKLERPEILRYKYSLSEEKIVLIDDNYKDVINCDNSINDYIKCQNQAIFSWYYNQLLIVANSKQTWCYRIPDLK